MSMQAFHIRVRICMCMYIYILLFFSKELWPVMDKWIKYRKGHANIAYTPDIIIASILRLIGELSVLIKCLLLLITYYICGRISVIMRISVIAVADQTLPQ